MKTVGQRIRELRQDAHMTQDELAAKIGYKSRSSINKIETARNIPMPKVETFAKALGVTPSYLMGWEEEERNRLNAIELIENPEIERLVLYAGGNIPRADLAAYVNALICTIDALNQANKKTPQ